MKIPSLDTAANLAVIAAAAVVLIGFARQPASSPTGPRVEAEASPPPEIAVYKVGDRIQPWADIRFEGETFLLLTRSTCAYCTRNMPLYQAMLAKGARMIAVAAEDLEANQAYLAEHEVVPSRIVPLAATGLQFRVTPSMISVDSDGTVTGTWWGFQTERSSEAILRRLQ